MENVKIDFLNEETFNARMLLTETRDAVYYGKHSSSWERGVNHYASELIETVIDYFDTGYITIDNLVNGPALHNAMLNGARTWKEYSYGGCSLIYDNDIARRLCTDSELRKTENGNRNPNKFELWLDVQSRALAQAETIAIAAIMAAFSK